MKTDLDALSVLGEDGLLQQHLSDFKPRQVQLDMAEAVTDSIHNNSVLVAEAATGTGKTFAYLIPAMLSGKKIIISTGTKNLQDQLFYKDLPLLLKLLKRPVQVALLKGRSNYLCKERIEQHHDEAASIPRDIASQVYRIKIWSSQTKQGDISELKHISEKDAVWPYVTSSKDNCLGKECSHYDNCFLVKARQRAQKADIIIVNHYLFFADLGLKDSGFGELLPDVDTVIFDEAHQLPEIATLFFGKRWSSRQLLELIRDSEIELFKNLKANRAIIDIGQTLIRLVSEMRLAFGREKTSKPWAQIANKRELRAVISNVLEQLTQYTQLLEGLAPTEKSLANCWKRALEILGQFNVATGETPDGEVHWYETFARSFAIHLTPLNIAKAFRPYLEEDKRGWIFTSATLAVSESFDFFRNRMGIDAADCLQLPAVFDYKNKTSLYLPLNIPNPSDSRFLEAVVNAAIPIIEIAEGRTFFLFTSHAALQYAATVLQQRIAYPVLVQGSMPKQELLNDFRELGNAVLLGTSSFWEGVDVKGEALSCVIIDKLPFASPYEPILQARINALRKEGKEPFFDYQIPQAVIALKQGVGRLIRDIQDSGLLMLCDPRIHTKHYGRIFIKSLPETPIIRTLVEVQDFFYRINHERATL